MDADDLSEPVRWTARAVVPFALLFLLLGTVVVIGILRIGGVIAWPALWLVLLLFVVLLLPLAAALIWASNDPDADGPIWSGRGWF